MCAEDSASQFALLHAVNNFDTDVCSGSRGFRKKPSHPLRLPESDHLATLNSGVDCLCLCHPSASEQPHMPIALCLAIVDLCLYDLHLHTLVHQLLLVQGRQFVSLSVSMSLYLFVRSLFRPRPSRPAGGAVSDGG